MRLTRIHTRTSVCISFGGDKAAQNSETAANERSEFRDGRSDSLFAHDLTTAIGGTIGPDEVMPAAMSKKSLRKTAREFLSELAPDQMVRVGADKPGTGAKTWPAGELLHDWNEQGSPYLDLDATVMNGRLYIPDPTDPKDLQVFLKIVDDPDEEGP